MLLLREKIGIAIISYAFEHAYQCTEALIEDPDAYIPIIWDDYKERGEAAAKKYNLLYTDSLDYVLQLPEVEGVIISSETNKHLGLIKKAAEAGKAILCQKPLAHTLKECDRIIEIIDKTGVPFSLAFQMRYDPIRKKVRELLNSGVIGAIFALRCRHGGPWMLDKEYMSHPFRSWLFDPKCTPGMFMWEGIHVADFMLWILGEPVSVTAQIGNIVTDIGYDDTGLAVYRFKNGEMGIHFSSAAMLAAENSLEIYGDKGVIIQNYGDTSSTEIRRDKKAVALKMYSTDFEEKKWKEFDFSNEVSQLDRKKAPAYAFLDYIRGKDNNPVTARKGRKSVEMILGAYKSAREERTIYFSLEDK